ncbi:hypothetical protein ABZP36_024640 [Zizania latifolia]
MDLTHYGMYTMTSARRRARLDYLDSQEPSDGSQANAIDIVDRLLVEDDIETYQKISTDQITRAKSASTLGSKKPFNGADDLYQEYDIGPNTQMAAEAMEALLNASTDSYDVRENDPESSTIVDMTKGTKVDKTCAVHSPIQKRKVTYLRQRSGGVATQYKHIKVDDTVKENGESSISLTKRPSTSKTRKDPKQMARKAKGNIVSGIVKRTIDHEILTHFGLSVATAISEATHFVAEKFARTKNMLEAIAMGIPVVTPAWLECCREASCFIDEKRYILRDIKKEKELGFSMPLSLSRAFKNPLLEGRRVLITPNAKPGKELLKSLVVAAHGKVCIWLYTSFHINIHFLLVVIPFGSIPSIAFIYAVLTYLDT